jgi:hypothetical protein
MIGGIPSNSTGAKIGKFGQLVPPPAEVLEGEGMDVENIHELIAVLSHHTGERGNNEGAIDVVKRIIRERDTLLANAIKEKLLKLS